MQEEIEKEDCCCGSDCDCEHEHNHQEEHLSEEEIEQIINEKYSEKDEKTKAFIRKGLSKFGNRFDYSKTVYINATEKITIRCKKHNLEFEQVANQHYRPNYSMNPCPSCAHEVRHSIMIERNKEGIPRVNRTLDLFLRELRNRGLESIYDLSTITEYKNAITPVEITKLDCEHSFRISPNRLLKGYIDCPICAQERSLDKRRMQFSGFKEKAVQTHGEGRYFYDFDENKTILNNRQKIKIKCNICGNIFWQEASAHLQGEGCPDCKSISKGEDLVRTYLSSKDGIIVLDKTPVYGVSSVRVFVVPDFRIIVDTREIWIEYNGIQHYRPSFDFNDGISPEERFFSQYTRDNDVRNYCKEKGILLIEIPYTMRKLSDVSNFLDEVIFNHKDPLSLIDYDSLYLNNKDNST